MKIKCWRSLEEDCVLKFFHYIRVSLSPSRRYALPSPLLLSESVFIHILRCDLCYPSASILACFQASIRNRRVALLCRNLKGKLCEYVHKQSFLHGLGPSFVLYIKYNFSEAGSASFPMCKLFWCTPYVQLVSNPGIHFVIIKCIFLL